MIAIAEAYEAIKTTLPEGDVAQPPQIDERSGVRIWLDRGFVDRLGDTRAGGEQQRRDRAAGGGVTAAVAVPSGACRLNRSVD